MANYYVISKAVTICFQMPFQSGYKEKTYQYTFLHQKLFAICSGS